MSSQHGAAAVADRALRGRTAARPVAYSIVLALAALSVFVYDLRMNGVFGCSSDAYAAGRYLAYCNSASYNDYDHGAFWFGLEPRAVEAARSADVLFLGTSRMQFGFSSDATRGWFEKAGAAFYLLGFSYSENVTFTGPLLEKLAPEARVYVINADRFFETAETVPAAEVFHGDAADSRHRRKRLWQRPHRLICDSVPLLCGDRASFFRNVDDGTWLLQGSDGLEPGGIGEAPPRTPKELEERIAVAEAFVGSLPVPRECVLLTVVPTKATPRQEAVAIAKALGIELYAPHGDGLATFDDSHLDRPSAETWSAEFFAAAGDHLRRCLGDSQEPRRYTSRGTLELP